jgi:predicted transcriptional regulator
LPKLRETKEQMERRRFKHWIKNHMDDLGLSQTDIGECLNISQCAISLRINGKREWSLSEMAKLCELFNEQYVVGGIK